jgi:hypothetical protein
MFLITSCTEETEENPITKDQKAASTDLKLFTSSVFSQMESPMALIEFRLDHVLGDAGITDGSIQSQLPDQMTAVANFYIDAITKSIDLTSPAYFIVDDIDTKKGQLSQGMGLLKIGNKEAFQSFINENGSPTEIDGYGFMDLDKIQIAWKNDVAIIGFSNTSDGAKYVQNMMKNGLKGQADERLAKHLTHEDDIHLFIPGKEAIESIYTEHKATLNSDVTKAVETILKDVQESNISLAINFENGEIKLKAINNISEELKPLVNILADKSVSSEKINSINSSNSIGYLSMKLDTKKFSENFTKYVFDNKLLDESFKSQSQTIDKMLSGDLVFSLTDFENKKPKGIALLGTKTSESKMMVQMLLNMQGLTSKSVNNDILFMVNNATWQDDSEKAEPKEASNHPFFGSFDASKLDANNFDPIFKQILPHLSQIEFSGNFIELNGTLKGTNQEENILKTIITQTINIKLNKNGMASK